MQRQVTCQRGCAVLRTRLGRGVPLFPELDDTPLIVKELKDAGLSMQDALEIWQQGFRCVHEGVRPPIPAEAADVAFEDYIREKLHLLKRKLTSGKVENITGFLLEAIRKNFANPEFVHSLGIFIFCA